MSRIMISSIAAAAFLGDRMAPKDELVEVDGHYELDVPEDVLVEQPELRDSATLSQRVIDHAEQDKVFESLLSQLLGDDPELVGVGAFDGDEEESIDD